MPACPRCNKMLSTHQALAYHMNRKVRCNTLACSHCYQSFSTKHTLMLHEMHCKTDRSAPDLAMLFAAYEEAPWPIAILTQDRVTYRNEAARFMAPLDCPASKLKTERVVARVGFSIAFLAPQK